ncbi:TolC family protein [Desulfobacterota bacterium AH_259_B03_O07]|nr:TolC family protein [Desulfobacterota bacterium AH_259_B03_O07]
MNIRITKNFYFIYITFSLLVFIVFVFAACVKDFPELDPAKQISPAPSEEWEPPPEEYSEFFPAEELPGIPTKLKPFADELTLSQLVDVALELNPTTLQAWEQAKSAAAAWGVARGIYYPQVDGTLNYSYGSGGGTATGLDPYDEQFAYAGLTLNYLLLDFGGRSAQSKAAQQALFTANWNHNQVIQDVLRNVAVAFYNYIGNKAQVRADEVSLNEAQTSLEAAELRLEAGVGTLPDVLQAKATMAQVQFDLVSDQGAVQTSRGKLATVIGWPADTAFDVSGEPEELPLAAIEQNVEDLIAVAKQNRPELAAVQAFVERRQAELREAKSNLWPQLSAIAQIARWWVRPDGSSSDYFTNYLFGLQLQFPIFQGFALINSVREARSDLKAAQAALLLEEQVVIEDVWNAYYNFRTAAGQLEASEVLLASSKESFDASLARFRSGVGDIVELLNAQTLLAEARAEKIKATTSLFTSFADLVHAIGAELPSYNNGSIPEMNDNDSEGEVIYEEEK